MENMTAKSHQTKSINKRIEIIWKSKRKFFSWKYSNWNFKKTSLEGLNSRFKWGKKELMILKINQ